MANVLNQAQLVTGEVRLSFVNVFEPKAMAEGQEPKYSVTCIVPKTDEKTIKRMNEVLEYVKQQAKDKKFGGKIPPVLASAWKDGDTATDRDGELYNLKYPEYKGCYFIRCSTKQKPKVFDANRDLILDPSVLYSGCYGRASMTLFAYNNNGNKGISASLNNVMMTREGEPLTPMLTGSEFDEE